MIMTERRMYSYNFAYKIMSDILYQKESKQSFYSTKNSLVINLKGKLFKSLSISLRCQTRRIWLAHLLVEILRGFELWRNWSIQLR